MKHLRLLLVMLLSVAVPFTATASMIVPMSSCAGAHAGSSYRAAAAAAPDCCDAESATAGWQKATHKSPPCKAGVECKACVTVSLAFSSVDILAFRAPAQDAPLLGATATPRHDPFGLWRPPRSV